jgi:hypothetical protein
MVVLRAAEGVLRPEAEVWSVMNSYLFEIVNLKDEKLVTDGEIEGPSEAAVRKMFTLAAGTELRLYEEPEPEIVAVRPPLVRVTHY